MSAVFAIYPVNFYATGPRPAGGKSKAKTAPGQDLLALPHQMVDARQVIASPLTDKPPSGGSAGRHRTL